LIVEVVDAIIARMHLQFKERLKSFFAKYYIKVLSSDRRHPIFKVNKFFEVDNDMSLINVEPVTHTEPMITLDIPLSKLNALADVEAIFFNNEYNDSSRRLFEAIMDLREEETYLRNKYPAVKQAYEQYSTMLHLCRERPVTIKDLS